MKLSTLYYIVILALLLFLGLCLIVFSIYLSHSEQVPSQIKTLFYSDPVIAAAGDIACDPSADRGQPMNCDENSTASLVENLNPQAVLTLGDTQYEDNTYQAYMQIYDKSWGKFKNITYPAIGNHEYLNLGAYGYFRYFGGNAGPPNGYYSFDLGSWHIISLNSECSHIGGCHKKSPEEKWLLNDLAEHPGECILAYWHEPRFSSGEHGDAKQMATIWGDLVKNHAALVLNGHNHDYERFVPLDSDGNPDSNGTAEFIVGTGGKNHYGFISAPLRGEAVRNSDTYGILKLVLYKDSYDWQFIPADGTFTDSGNAHCIA